MPTEQTPSPADIPAESTDDPVLVAERAHLATARAALNRMQQHSAGLEATAGDHVSLQYVKQVLYRRMKALSDDPSVPLFFGRVDYATAAGAEADETFHLGRRHVVEYAGGEPLVIDWRAPMAMPFYQAKPGEPMGVRLRRRFGFHDGRLSAYEDERLDQVAELDETASDILQAEIERPRTGPMRDIVATIQPEQDVIVRTDLSTSVCVQGAPGTGKTAVGLHRAAYLLYAYREQLSRSGVLVVGPNDNFLRYIGDVLPALGEIEATSETVDSLLGKANGLTVRGLEDAQIAVIKGDARLAEVLRRAVWSHVGQAKDSLVVPRGHRQWRVPAYQVEEIIAELRGRRVRYAAGREMLPQRLAHRVLLRLEAAGDSPDDRVQAAVARSAPVKAMVNALWPAVDPRRLVLRLLTDAEFLAVHADGLLDEDEQAMLLRSRPGRSATSARWTSADLALIDEAADLLHRTPSLGHVIIDEAQDLSAMQLRAVGRRASTGSVTLLGDLAQATTPWASRSWSDALGHLDKPDTRVEELTAGFRVPRSVIEFAARLLPTIAPQLNPPHSVRRSVGDLELRPGGATAVAAAVRTALADEGSIGVIVSDAWLERTAGELSGNGIGFTALGAVESDDEADEHEFDDRVDLVPAGLAKGLEFDHVVLWEPAAIMAGEADRVTGLRRLYVCLTRAVTSLVVVHDQPLPEELAG